MTALDVLSNIVNNDVLLDYQFKYCLVDDTKKPHKMNGDYAKPNVDSDFVDLEKINVDVLTNYRCLGISIQGSKVCAIDIDHCVISPFDKSTINSMGQEIINIFKDKAYIEFSFSGTGIRIFFKSKPIHNYITNYYIKNSKLNIEYYYPEGSARYVTITGRTIYNNYIADIEPDVLQQFLDTYMKRHLSKITHSYTSANISFEELMKKVKYCYLTNNNFQDLWFDRAPGSNSNESERDFHLVAFLYEYITQDKEMIRKIFEESNFFKTKDYKHIKKWTNNNHRYFNYLYDRISNKGA